LRRSSKQDHQIQSESGEVEFIISKSNKNTL